MIEKAPIQITDICFSYDSEMVLKHISLELKSNRICFVMGNNGSGKTTLLKTLMGFLLPTNGKILIDGVETGLADKRLLSRIVSYVPQAINLNTDFNVIDYLSLGRSPYMRLSGKLSDNDFEVIERYAARLGVNKIYDIPFNKLSGGQKQMVTIARSLIQNTPYMIMDEPMSALDIGKQVELLRIINELVNEGKTIVMTTHNPNHALSLESDSCFLVKGEVYAYGRSSDVINEKLLKEIYGPGIDLNHIKGNSFAVFNLEMINESVQLSGWNGRL